MHIPQENGAVHVPASLAPFLDGQGRLTALPAKNKKKLLALWYLAQKISAAQSYSEAEINDLLDSLTTFHDPATLRRELYNKRLLHRTADGGCYWREAALPTIEDFMARYL